MQKITSLNQSGSSDLFNYFMLARSSDPRSVLREQTIRYVTLFSAISLSIIGVFSPPESISTESILWHILVLVFAIVIFYFLQTKQIRYASYIMGSSMILIVLDQSATFWSPSTVAFTVMYSLLFHIIYEDPMERKLFLAINLALYSLITICTHKPSPLSVQDYYSSPASAIMITIAINLIIYGIAHNIRREQYEQDQIRLMFGQQEVDMLRQFLGSSSHDLRTILSRIRMKSYLIQRKASPEVAHDIDDLSCSIDYLEQSLLAMIEMSRLDSHTDYEECALTLNFLLVQLYERYTVIAENKNVRLQIESPAGMIHVRGNSELLVRAIDNILKNALEFSPEESSIRIALHTNDKQVLIRIRDSGKGIPEADLPHIFERFYRGDKARQNPDGRVGLGLSIAKKIIELHRGQVLAENNPDKGASFTISLPLD